MKDKTPFWTAKYLRRPGFRGPWPRSMLLALIAVVAMGGVAAAQGVDIEEVFWCEEPESEGELSLEECQEARDLLLFECTACHTFVPVVQAQKTPEEWDATFDAHADRLSELDEPEVELIRRFVVTHYNPDQPVPELPEELQEEGNNQAF